MAKTIPFRTVPGSPPPHLAGRDEQTKLMELALGQLGSLGIGQPIILYGPRGMGKTTLMKWLRQQCVEQGVQVKATTPARGLRKLRDIPRLVLPPAWYPHWKAEAKRTGLGDDPLADLDASIRFTDEAGEEVDGDLVEYAKVACRSCPRVVLMDEAHSVPESEDGDDRYQALLNVVHDVSSEAPLMLALAGTPGLEPRIRDVGASFMERAWAMGVGPLTFDEAIDAVAQPLGDDGIIVDASQLERIASESHCYPHFLQHWGLALCAGLTEEPRPVTVTQECMDAASARCNRVKESFYRRRYNHLNSAGNLLPAALAVSQGFSHTDEMDLDEIKSLIDDALRVQVPDDELRKFETEEAASKLHDLDFFWAPPESGMRPGIPSFMDYTVAWPAKGGRLAMSRVAAGGGRHQPETAAQRRQRPHQLLKGGAIGARRGRPG